MTVGTNSQISNCHPLGIMNRASWVAGCLRGGTSSKHCFLGVPAELLKSARNSTDVPGDDDCRMLLSGKLDALASRGESGLKETPEILIMTQWKMCMENAQKGYQNYSNRNGSFETKKQWKTSKRTWRRRMLYGIIIEPE